MRLEQVMDRNPVVVHPGDKVVDAALRMRDRGVSATLVSRGDTLVGILTERDLAHKLAAEGRSSDSVLVEEIMTPDPITASPETPVWEAMSRLTVKGLRHLPVCRDGIPLGIVSTEDLATVASSGAKVQALMTGLDEHSRARLTDVLLWVIGQLGIRREDLFPIDED